MAYVPVPKDLSRVKPKVLFNLTKRQLICFGGGALIGVPLFFLLKDGIGVSAAALAMVFSMLPFFLLGMYEKNGQPMEKVIRNYLNVHFFRAKYRPYRTDNYYAALERQHQLDMEVNRIVTQRKRTHKKADPRRAPGDRRRPGAGAEHR